MAKSILTAEDLRTRFSYDSTSGLFTRLIGVSGNGTKAGTIAGSKDDQGYLKITISGQYFKAHRLAWLYVYGVWPVHEVDHINGIRSDNRIINLRDTPRVMNSENQRSCKSNNKSKLLGVASPCGKDKKFTALITVNGKTARLGRFDTADEAHQCYIQAKRKMHNGCTL